MFGYLRLFLMISIGAVIGFAVVGGMFLRSVALDDLTRVVETSNASLAKGYANTVWKRYRDVIVPLATNAPEQLKDNPQVPYFAQDTVRYFRDMPLVRVNIYNGNGLLLLSHNVAPANKLIGSSTSPDKGFAAANIKKNIPSSHIIDDVMLQNNERGKVVQTLVPITPDAAGQPPEGAVEVIFNVTEPYDKLLTFQIVTTCVVIFVLFVFLLILSIVSRKSEAIIAKQHEANQELQQAAAAAQAENRDKSQFLANISHELRTPLNAIIGFSEIIKTELLPTLQDRKYDQYVGDIHTSGVHLLSLINDILDFSKAEAGKLALEVSEVDATKMVQNSMRLVSPRAEAGGVTLVENLPKEHLIMVTDGKKFKQVLLNLFSNAVKFTPSGGTVTVTAWQTLGDDTVTFEVQDTGIGIAPKDISRAMSPFGQVDNTLKRKYEGTGLGLPLTKKFIELMGGKFSIESELEKGTKITFVLPREAKDIDGVTIKQAS